MPSSGIQVAEAVDLLRRWLKNSNLRPGSRLPSERVLAAQVGATHYAVNRAMTRLILEGVVDREGYKLRLAGDSSRPSVSEPFTCDLVVSNRSVFLSSFRRVARELGIKLNIHRWESSEEAAALLQQLNRARSQGILFDAPAVLASDWEPVTRALRDNGIPVVCVGQTVPGVTTVLSDSSRSFEKGIEHAAQIGHREFGLIVYHTQAKWLPSIRENWERATRGYGSLSSTRLKVLDGTPRSIAEFWLQEWPDASCVLIQHEKLAVDQVIEELANLGRRVPTDLSVISVGFPKSPYSGSNITSILADAGVIHEVAYHWLQRIRRKWESSGMMPPPTNIRVEPLLAIKDTVGPCAAVSSTNDPSEPALTFANPWTGDHDELMKTLEMAVARPYPLALRAREAEFKKLDLSEMVNRPLNFRRGWLGDLPLKYLNAGRHIIHGVPFHVLGGPSRSDCGVVVFQSSINSTGKAQRLPDSLRIPIERRVQAIYILHGCGFSRHLQEFASYTFHGKKKVLDCIPLITLADVPPDTKPEELEKLKDMANIQDWWPDYPQMDFKQGRMVPLLETEGQETVHRHSFVYTLEWINPRPEEKVSYLEVKARTDQPTTLGLLAISLLPVK